MAKLPKGRPSSNDGTGWIEAEAQKITEGEGGEWIALTKQGKRAKCPRCGQCKLAVGVGDRKVKLTCWSDVCRPTPEARREIATLLTKMPGRGYDPSGRNIAAPFSVRRDVRSIKPLPQPDVTVLLSLGKAERKVLLWLATLAKGRSWLTVTQRSTSACCKVSTHDAVPILRRLAELGLIEVQKNGYAAKRATKLRFLVSSEAVSMSFGGLGEKGVTKLQKNVTMERVDSYVLVRLTECAVVKKRHWDDAPVDPASANKPSTTKRDAPPRSLDGTMSAAACENKAPSSDPTPTRMPQSTLRQQQIENEEKRIRRAAWNEEQRNLTVRGKSDG